MTKGRSESEFRQVLNDVDLPLKIYKPPDDVRNWKPCDYMLWWPGDGQVNCAWIEVKEIKLVNTFPLSEFRPTQRKGIADADELGMPYFVAIWWPLRHVWTISDAIRIVGTGRRSVTFTELAGTYGVDARPHVAGSIVRQLLEEGL